MAIDTAAKQQAAGARTTYPPEFWDGVQHAYIPHGEPKVPEPLRLHRDAAEDIDPITYEVIRHGLWNANAEHVRVIENLAVSPIAVEIRDFQPCILTEDAELLYFGPCLQYMSGMLDVQTRYVLERRGERVRDGDMWLCNDPIVGTAHQPDVGLMCPLFIDGEVFFSKQKDLALRDQQAKERADLEKAEPNQAPARGGRGFGAPGAGTAGAPPENH